MEMNIALASVYPVDKLPKGSKVTGYEIYSQSNKLLGKGAAGTVKQALNRVAYHAALNMTVNVTVLAMDGEHQIKMTAPYVLKATGPVKVI